jgi:hypothetical protein
VPVAIVGVDDEGMVAFANRDAEELLRDFGPLVGRDAEEVLPVAIRPVLQSPDGVPVIFMLNGRRCRGVSRAMSASTGVSGRLLVLMPQEEAPTSAEPRLIQTGSP